MARPGNFGQEFWAGQRDRPLLGQNRVHHFHPTAGNPSAKKRAPTLREANPAFFDMDNKLDMSTVYYSQEIDQSLSLLPDLLGKDVFFEGREGRRYNLGDFTSIWARSLKGALPQSATTTVLPFRLTIDRDLGEKECFIVELKEFKDRVDQFREDDSQTLLLAIISIEKRALFNSDRIDGGHVNGITIRKMGPKKTLGLQYFEPHVQTQNVVSGAEGSLETMMYGDLQDCMRSACAALGIAIFSNAVESIDDRTETAVTSRALLPLSPSEKKAYTKYVKEEGRVMVTKKIGKKYKKVPYKPWPEYFPDFYRFRKLQTDDQLCQTWVTWYLVLRGMGQSHEDAVKYMMYHRYSGLLAFVRYLLNCVPDWSPPKKSTPFFEKINHSLPLCDLLLITGEVQTVANPAHIHLMGALPHSIPAPYTVSKSDRLLENKINANGRTEWNLKHVDFDKDMGYDGKQWVCNFYYTRWAPLALKTADLVRSKNDFGDINPSLDIYHTHDRSGGDEM